MTQFLIEDEHLSLEQAMDKVYNSKHYKKLLDTRTGFYRESGGYNYQILKGEV